MKIAYVITRSDVIGGASAHVLDLAESAQKEGHQVVILVGQSGLVCEEAGRRQLRLVSLRYLVREISIIEDVKAVFELKRQLNIIQPDVVHVHSAKAAMLGRVAAKLIGLPVVYTAHGWPFTEGVSGVRASLYKFIEQTMARYTDKIITVSEYDYKLAIDSGGALNDREKLIIIHNGVHDLPKPTDNYAVGDALVRFIMVARFEAPKEQETVIKALARLKQYQWRFEFVGDGPGFDGARKLAHDLGLSERVTFSGARSDVPDRLNASDVFVLISRWEGLPLTILEAMRANLPVIASNVGGVQEAVVAGETGMLVKRGDFNGLVGALEKAMLNHDTLDEMGARARDRFERLFEFDQMFGRTMSVYREVAGRVG